MKFMNRQRFFLVPSWMATGLCCGFLAFASPAPAQDQDIADQIEDRLRPGSSVDEGTPGGPESDADDGQFRRRVEDALNGRPSPPLVDDPERATAPDEDLGQIYYRDAQGRFFFVDPQGGRVYSEQQPPGARMAPFVPRAQTPQGPQLGVIITDSPEGIRIDRVQAGSVAAEAGIEPGDVLRQFDGQPISDPRQLQRLVQSASAGESVELTVMRNGEEQTLTAAFREDAAQGQRYGASKPATGGANLQQEVEQLRSEVEALRREMNRLHGQQRGGAENRPTSPPPAVEGTVEQETLEVEREVESPEARVEATESLEAAESPRAESSEKIDLSIEEAEVEAEAETDAPAPGGSSGPSSL